MSGWVAAGIAAVVAAAAAARAIWAGGRRDGTLEAILQRVTDILDDHENRIRLLEHRPARRARH